MSLLVTGTISIDTVHTPTEQREGVAGGSCAYFAAAASFHAPVRVVCAVGGDWPADHRELLGSFDNICLGGLDHRPQSQTFAWGGRYFENLNRRETLFTELGVLDEAPPVVPEAYRDSRYVFLANTHPAAQLELMEKFPDAALIVADTMDLWIRTELDALQELMRNIDGLVLNDSEAAMLTGQTNMVAASGQIIPM